MPEFGKTRALIRDQIAARGDNLDLTWLRDESAETELPGSDVIAAEIIDTLRVALEEMEALADLLGGDEAADGAVAEAAE